MELLLRVESVSVFRSHLVGMHVLFGDPACAVEECGVHDVPRRRSSTDRSSSASFGSEVLSLDTLSPIRFSSTIRRSKGFGCGRVVNVSSDVGVTVHDSSLSVLVIDSVKCLVRLCDGSEVESSLRLARHSSVQIRCSLLNGLPGLLGECLCVDV